MKLCKGFVEPPGIFEGGAELSQLHVLQCLESAHSVKTHASVTQLVTVQVELLRLDSAVEAGFLCRLGILQ